MFGLFSRARRSNLVAQHQTFAPTLERLEERNCPSTISLSIASYAQNKMVTLTGQVTNTPAPGGQTVQLSGAVSGSATTDGMGDFSVTLQATALDYVFAQTADGQSNIAQVLLTDQAPTSSYFNAIEYGGNMLYMYGNFSGSNLAGDVVTFGGLQSLQGLTTTLDQYGNWWQMVELNGLPSDSGFATAQVTDWWGATSQVAVDLISEGYC